MYNKGNLIFADAGKVLVSAKFKGYKTVGNIEDFHEIPVDLTTGTLENNIVSFNNKYVNIYLYGKRKNYSYVDWKTEIIKWQFSNDDQIAIMLNKDSSEDTLLLYNKMQEWREWAGELAHKLIDLINNT